MWWVGSLLVDGNRYDTGSGQLTYTVDTRMSKAIEQLADEIRNNPELDKRLLAMLPRMVKSHAAKNGWVADEQDITDAADAAYVSHWTILRCTKKLPPATDKQSQLERWFVQSAYRAAVSGLCDVFRKKKSEHIPSLTEPKDLDKLASKTDKKMIGASLRRYLDEIERSPAVRNGKPTDMLKMTALWLATVSDDSGHNYAVCFNDVESLDSDKGMRKLRLRKAKLRTILMPMWIARDI